MTHDELLANIDKYLIPTMAQEPNFNGAIGILKALRAVVELHKPYKVNDIFLCDVEPLAYPCPTIQAIETELK